MFENRNNSFEDHYKYCRCRCFFVPEKLPMLPILNKYFLLLVFSCLLQSAIAQKGDTSKAVSHFSGNIQLTNNGLSFIPTFLLGKPAAILNLSTGRGRLTFEPELRFSLEGKPWSFLFWWRYKLVNSNRFSVNLGAHPAVNFRSTTTILNGVSTETTVARRYLAGEIVPRYQLSPNIGLGSYYLYSRGLDEGTTRVTHFLTLNASFSHIPLPGKLLLRAIPQVFYLKMDDQDGYFVSASLNLSARNFPLSLGSVVNKRISSNIAGSKDFVWNLSLNYSFHKKYLRQ